MPDVNNECVLLTGATGFFGTRLAEELVVRGATVYAVVRPKDQLDAGSRLARLWYENKTLMGALGTQVVPLDGDITTTNLGLDEETVERLCGAVTAVIHTAADVNINQTLNALRTANVTATHHVLDLAQRINAHRPLHRFLHVSTAYVAGKRRGFIAEDSLIDQGFNSLYEQTKFEAEELVRACASELPVTILRPTQIVGDSKTGWITAFNTVYYPLKMYLRGSLPVIPISPDQKLNIVPVDYVVSIALAALTAPDESGATYHCTLPRKLQPTVSEVVDATRAWARNELRLDLRAPLYVNAAALGAVGSERNLKQLTTVKRKGFLENMLALAPYFNDEHEFSTANTERLMGAACTLSWRSFLPVMLAYAVNRSFLTHTGRTAFEQMLVRLSSKRVPLTYFDVAEDGIHRTTAQEMKERVLALAAALRAVGIAPGDRVALVGVNSSAYTAVDAAIGLVGGVSVPLYYTSPYADICTFVQRSRAKLLFIGMEKLARAAAEADPGVPCVLMPPIGDLEGLPATMTPWEVFLGIGRMCGSADPLPAADYDDIATIRYTSGTTGAPKGTMFTQYQLAWMGETMPEILDWKTRTSPIRYLSFLPMSHVVEGILVAYAPFYLLSDAEVYCLNDFSKLEETLPKVRPTVFFSVPRFYEKVWNQFTATGAGKRYLTMKSGPAKRVFGAICRRVILKRAGLDACRQLIVGSAPIRVDLLEAYRELGIEIHNAFGLTEAPLITLNRRGHNDLGSLGQPLPQTDLKIDESGEIWMRGPQLTVGYDGMGPLPTDGDGFFATGDLGSFSPKGNVVIQGRRKELVVTSYGKNVQSEKIESLVKAIPGVSEAMLVGDARPYCTALVWLEDDASFDPQAFDAAIEAMNEGLSHPEMLKRWAVMEQPLALSSGELTPNLKMRRKVILEHYPQVIAALYDTTGVHDAAGARHVGAMA